MISEELLQKVLKELMKNGGEYAEVFVEKKDSFSAQLEDQKIEKLIKGTDSGVGLRLIFKGKTFYGYTNSFFHKDLLELASLVRKAAKEDLLEEDISLQKASADITHPYRIHPTGVSTERKINLIRIMDRVAREYSSSIKQVLVIYRESIQNVRIANSEEQIADDHRVYTLALVQVVAAEDGVIQTGYEPVGGLIGFEIFEKNPPEEIASKAASRAVMMLKAPRAPAGRMPVVISSEAGGTMIHEAIGHGLEADLALQGLSVYSGRIGQQVASPVVTVIDDATILNKRGSFSFDDEGTPAQKTILVEKGILINYMYDRLYAIKDNKTSTGNGRRQSYKHRPIPRMTNTMVAPGPHSPEKIINSVQKGLFVKKMGGGQVNTINGDFVFEVQEGYLIKNGGIDTPVRGAILTGNGPEVLRSIEMVGTDLGFGIGTCGKDGQGVPVADALPTLLIPDMVVGGEIK